jgi:hypothetical protein
VANQKYSIVAQWEAKKRPLLAMQREGYEYRQVANTEFSWLRRRKGG